MDLDGKLCRARDVVFIENNFPANSKDFSKNEMQRETEVVQTCLTELLFNKILDIIKRTRTTMKRTMKIT